MPPLEWPHRNLPSIASSAQTPPACVSLHLTYFLGSTHALELVFAQTVGSRASLTSVI